jgi:hypothetical protein
MSTQDLSERQFGRFGTFAGGICLPRDSKDARAHPMQHFMSELASLLVRILILDPQVDDVVAQRDALITSITKLTQDAGVGSMIGQSVGECLVSIKNWTRRAKLGLESPNSYLATCSASSANATKTVTTKVMPGRYAELARANIFYKKATCLAMAASQDAQDDASRLDFYFGPQVDAELNGWQLNILLLTFLKVPTRHRQDLTALYAMHNVRKLLGVHVEGRHFLLTPELAELLPAFLGRLDPSSLSLPADSQSNEDAASVDDDDELEEARQGGKSGGASTTFLRRSVKDDTWQLCLSSNCLPLALLLRHQQDPAIFDKSQYALYFGALGLAESHIFDVRYSLDFVREQVNRDNLALYGPSELLTLASSARAMGDDELLELLPVECMPGLGNGGDCPEEEPLAKLQMQVARLHDLKPMKMALRLTYASRPQLSVEYFHHRQAYMWPHGFVVWDESPAKLLSALKAPYVVDRALLFQGSTSLKLLQGSLSGDGELMLRARAYVKFNVLDGTYECGSIVDFVQLSGRRGDLLLATYDDDVLKHQMCSLQTLSSIAAIRDEDTSITETFLQLAAHVNSYVNKNVLVALVH